MSDLTQKLALRRLNQVYCRIKPSPKHGVGIFAIRPIPVGTNPFKNSYMAQDACYLHKKHLCKLDGSLLELLEDYHPTDSHKKIERTAFPKQVVSMYPNQLIWTNYLNYVDEEEPNIELMEDGEWKTLRNIEVGEELLEDPSRLFNGDGSHKTFSVKPRQYPLLN